MAKPFRVRAAEIEAIAGAITCHAAFRRLGSITFLGILSPRFRSEAPGPVWKHGRRSVSDDGTRLDHSLGVASASLDLAERLDLSPSGRRYAVAWGLTHDIATWPLSHTGEAAFSQTTGWSSRLLREGIILGSPRIPEILRLDSALLRMDLDPQRLLSIFCSTPASRSDELDAFREVVSSPLTPDTLEGVRRTAPAFGLNSPDIDRVIEGFTRNRCRASYDTTFLHLARQFWEAKSSVYADIINRVDVVMWESAWSETIARLFAELPLEDTLSLSEAHIVTQVVESGLLASVGVRRYKTPQRYFCDARERDMLTVLYADQLGKLFRRQSAE